MYQCALTQGAIKCMYEEYGDFMENLVELLYIPILALALFLALA